MEVALAACGCLLAGFVVLSFCGFPGVPRGDGFLLRLPLAAGYGLGIFSVVFFLALLFPGTNLAVVDLAVLGLLIAAGIVHSLLSSRKFRLSPQRSSPEEPSEQNDARWPAWLRRIVTASFAGMLAIAVYASIVRVIAFPQGDGWDAFTIWNLHARFLFLGGADWRAGFTPLAGGSHADYPLLLPAAIAHFWSLLGRDDPRVPAMIGMVFTFATVAALFAALSIRRGRVTAMMGAVALLATPFFFEQGTAQYADVPLSFFFLAAVVLLCLSDRELRDGPRPTQVGLLILAGLAAGFAAWTKNEGLLFLLALAVSRGMTSLVTPRGSGMSPLPGFAKSALPLLAAALPGLVLVVSYKHSIGVPGDLFSSPTAALPKLLSPPRYWAILWHFLKGTVRFGHWLLIPLSAALAGFILLVGVDHSTARQAGFRTSLWAVSLTLVGYFAVFLITPYDIYWHLRFSLSRLLLQLWPSVVFLIFLALGSGSHDAVMSAPGADSSPFDPPGKAD